MPKKSNNKTKTSYCGLHSDLLLELIYLIQELNEKLQYLEELELETEKSSESLTQIYGLEEESLENCECLLNEELWEELCKALESDKITFMGIT